MSVLREAEPVSLQDVVVHNWRRTLAKVGLDRLAPSPEDIWPYVRRISPSPERPASRADMAEIFYSHEGRLAHKWAHYHDIYDRHLARFRDTGVRFLEIGVSHGGSLQIWRKYLGANATIFGIDIDPRCAVVDDAPSINVRIGSQTDASLLRSVVAEMGGVDAIVDDGSHYVSHQRASFELLF